MARAAGNYLPLETINEDGKPPASRLNDPLSVQQIVDQLNEANDERSETDADVYGMISGNPPYSQSSFNRQAQGWRANFPSRIGEASFNEAKGSFEDIILESLDQESGGLAMVQTKHGEDIEKRKEWSDIITEEFQTLNEEDETLLYNLFLSIHDMVLYRAGPIIWEDDLDFRFRAVPQRYVLVPDTTRSAVFEWPLCTILSFYSADQLYGFIRDPAAATKQGWDVETARQGLMRAAPRNLWSRNKRFDWEFYAQRVRNNDLYWGGQSEAIAVAHVYYREFPKPGETEGKISRCSILRDYPTQKFLFRRIGCYEKWANAINPFYYDRGDGTHHSVKGYGIKGFALWSAYDRLQCHLVDSAFMSASMHFQAATPNDMQNISVTPFGPYFWHPPGGTYLPTQQLGANLEGPFSIKQDLLGTATSNLSQYRRQLSREKGNPPTAKQVEVEAQGEEVVGRSQLSRYFEQLDDLWAERFRRAANPELTLANAGGRAALEFQQRCLQRGVPIEALQKVKVTARRTVGYGSPQQRQGAYARMMQRYQLYDETGKKRILKEVTAADVGYRNLPLFIAEKAEPRYEADQKADATDKVAGMKVGVKPLVSPSQNPVIYATIYLKAMDEAAGTLANTNGQTIREVFSFLEVAGPATAEQLQRFKDDPKRAGEHKALMAHWEKLAALHDKLGKQLKQQAQKQQQEQMKRQQQMQEQSQKVNGELAIRMREVEGKLAASEKKAQGNARLREWTQRNKMAMDVQKHRQDLALKDATTASEIRRKAFSE